MPGSNAIPITVGVVGHLDVVTTEKHKQQILQLFKDLIAKYPGSPVYLFSSIAEGADRFVAKIFLDLKYSEKVYLNRLELIIPTPFCTEEYKKDFNEDSAREFDDFIKKAKGSFCINCEEYTGDRPQQYLRAGKFVADSSIILLAMWDGEKGKKGGTADVVRHKIAGDDENVAESTFEYDGSVFILPCRRSGSSEEFSNSVVNTPDLTLDLILRDPAIREALEKIEEINCLPSVNEEPSFLESQLQLFKFHDKLNDSQKLLMKWYSLFDIQSMKFRAKDIVITVWLFLFGFFFITTLEIYSNLSQSDPILGAAMFFVVVATVIYWFSRLTGNHRKYLINRTLAEALRIQFYWNIAGIGRNVSDFFLRIHRKDFTWLKYLLSAIYGITYNSKPITSEIITLLTDNWIKDQSGFFRSATSRMTKQVNFYNRISNISFFLAFGLLVSIFFVGSFYKEHNFLNDLLVIIGTFLGIFALIKAYLQMKGYNQLMNQYELMNVIYARADSKIAETETYGLNEEEKNIYLKELFFVIGKEALIENGNWYQIFKEKEPEIEGI